MLFLPFSEFIVTFTASDFPQRRGLQICSLQRLLKTLSNFSSSIAEGTLVYISVLCQDFASLSSSPAGHSDVDLAGLRLVSASSHACVAHTSGVATNGL